MPFGKHAGKTLGDILSEDPTYLDWLNDQQISNDRLVLAVAEINAKYSAEIERAIDERE